MKFDRTPLVGQVEQMCHSGFQSVHPSHLGYLQQDFISRQQQT